MSEGTSKAGGSTSKAPSATDAEKAAAAKAKAADEAAKAKLAKASADQAPAAPEEETPAPAPAPAPAPVEEVPAAPEAPAEPEAQDPDNPKFATADLIANARTLTGYGKYVLAGALSTLDGDAFTIEEAKQAAEAFTSKPVNPDYPENLTEVDPVSGAVTMVEPTVEPTPEEPAEES